MDTSPAAPGRRPGLSSFTLHMIAMALMLLDHLCAASVIRFARYGLLAHLGRAAFPLFAFMLAEGFFRTGNRRKYALRLLVFAVISEIPFNLMTARGAFNPLHQNVLWTFLLSVAAMALCERIRRFSNIVVTAALCALVAFVFFLLGIAAFVDYYGYGVLTVLLFYFTRCGRDEPAAKKGACIVAQAAGLYYINCEMLKGLIISISLFGRALEVHAQGFALLALPLIWLYNGRQGYYNKYIKYTYYLFYPAHMLIISVATALM